MVKNALPYNMAMPAEDSVNDKEKAAELDQVTPNARLDPGFMVELKKNLG